MQVRKQQLELDMDQQTGSKEEKEYIKAVYCHPAYLIYMQSTSWEMLGWRKHNLESRLPGEISVNLRYADDTTLMVKNAFNGPTSSLHMAEERISKSEDMSMETFKTKKQREKKTEKMKQNIQ